MRRYSRKLNTAMLVPVISYRVLGREMMADAPKCVFLLSVSQSTG